MADDPRAARRMMVRDLKASGYTAARAEQMARDCARRHELGQRGASTPEAQRLVRKENKRRE